GRGGQEWAGLGLSVGERCWRVGVGLRGAVMALRRPLFRPALATMGPDGAPRDISGMLRQVVARRRPEDSAALVAALARSIEQRRPLWEREAAVLQCPLSYSALMLRLGEARRAQHVAGAGAEGESEGLPS